MGCEETDCLVKSWEPIWSEGTVRRFRRLLDAMGVGYLSEDLLQEAALALCRRGYLAGGEGRARTTSVALDLKVLHDLCVNTCRREELAPVAAADVDGLCLDAHTASRSSSGPGREDLLQVLPLLEPYLTPREWKMYLKTAEGHATVEALAESLGLQKSWGHDCFSGLIHKVRKLLGDVGFVRDEAEPE